MKDLSEWTIGEVIHHCQNKGCSEGCPFFSIYSETGTSCAFSANTPCGWDIDFNAMWTKQEIKDAQDLIRLLGSDQVIISKGKDGQLVADSMPTLGSFQITELNPDLFPSLRPGNAVYVHEITRSVTNNEC